MNLIKLIWSEVFGLFVDDWFMAIAIVALVIVVALVGTLVSSLLAGTVLLTGAVATLIISTKRGAPR